MKKIFVFILLISLLLSICGCFPKLDGIGESANTRPIFEREDTEEYGITVNIEGVIYHQYPNTRWSMHAGNEIIGYAGTRKTAVITVEGDTERNFIYLIDNGASMLYRPLHRADIEVPEPSTDCIDTIIGSEYRVVDLETIYEELHECNDNEIIKELFEVWENGEKTKDWEGLSFKSGFHVINMLCKSNKVPGVYYDLDVAQKDGVFMFGNGEEGYVEMPVDLLERFVGLKVLLSPNWEP